MPMAIELVPADILFPATGESGSNNLNIFMHEGLKPLPGKDQSDVACCYRNRVKLLLNWKTGPRTLPLTDFSEFRIFASSALNLLL